MSGLPSGWLVSASGAGRRTGSSHAWQGCAALSSDGDLYHWACGRLPGRATTHTHRAAADLAAEAVPQQRMRLLRLVHQAQYPLHTPLVVLQAMAWQSGL